MLRLFRLLCLPRFSFPAFNPSASRPRDSLIFSPRLARCAVCTSMHRVVLARATGNKGHNVENAFFFVSFLVLFFVSPLFHQLSRRIPTRGCAFRRCSTTNLINISTCCFFSSWKRSMFVKLCLNWWVERVCQGLFALVLLSSGLRAH